MNTVVPRPNNLGALGNLARAPFDQAQFANLQANRPPATGPKCLFFKTVRPGEVAMNDAARIDPAEHRTSIVRGCCAIWTRVEGSDRRIEVLLRKHWSACVEQGVYRPAVFLGLINITGLRSFRAAQPAAAYLRAENTAALRFRVLRLDELRVHCSLFLGVGRSEDIGAEIHRVLNFLLRETGSNVCVAVNDCKRDQKAEGQNKLD